ncbi:hypothetical protein Goshw_008949 [Gossypium schwendimanii]|uniref:Uncharacterized protein n=1 Tax=Gossypium schwendimanii TaxID=34291 RepID=A0A7J9N0U6_GOSSC|nr:hypothetical protein [Gossypium schwendimanii]
MKSTMANLWHPVKGVHIRDLREKRGGSVAGPSSSDTFLGSGL